MKSTDFFHESKIYLFLIYLKKLFSYSGLSKMITLCGKLYPALRNSMVYNYFSNSRAARVTSFILSPTLWISLLFSYIILIPYQFLPAIKFAGVSVLQFIPVFLLSVIFFLLFFRIRGNLVIENKIVCLFLLVWLITGVISALQTPPFSLSVFNLFFFEFTGSLIFIFIIITPWTGKGVLKLWAVFTGCVTFIVLYSIWIHFFGEPEYFKNIFVTKMAENIKIAKASTHFTISSAFGNASMRASLIISAIPGLIFLIIYLKKTDRYLLFCLALAHLFIYFLALYLCETTGAWITFFLTGGIIFLTFYLKQTVIYIRNSKKLIFIPIILFAIAGVYRLKTTTDFDVKHRMLQWEIATGIVYENNLPFGIGTRNYSGYADKYKHMYNQFNTRDSHGFEYNVADNYWLTFLVERGVVGFIFVLTLFIIKIRRFSKMKHDEKNFLTVINYIVLSIPLCVYINGLFWDIGNHMSFRILFFIFLAFSYNSPDRRIHPGRQETIAAPNS